MDVSRFEQDVRKLEKLYREGVRIMEGRLEALEAYLEQEQK